MYDALLVDSPIAFAAEPAGIDAFWYYMERVWRTLTNVQFTIGDVRRIILPEQYGRQLRADLPEYWGQVNFA